MKTITYQRKGVSECRCLDAHTPILRYVLTFLFAFSLQSTVFALDPATASITNFFDEAEAYVLDSTGEKLTCYHNAPLLLTNCIAFAGATTNSARLNLTGVTTTLKLGSSTSNISYTVYAMNATNGTWWALISSVPTNWTEPYLQLKCTNSATIFIYPWKILKTKSPL